MNTRQKLKKAKEMIRKKDYKILNLERLVKRYIQEIKYIENKKNQDEILKETLLKEFISKQIKGYYGGIRIRLSALEKASNLDLTIEEISQERIAIFKIKLK